MENIASLKHRIVKKTEHRPPLLWGPPPFRLPLIGLPPTGLPPTGLPPFGLRLKPFGLRLKSFGLRLKSYRLPPFGLSHAD